MHGKSLLHMMKKQSVDSLGLCQVLELPLLLGKFSKDFISNHCLCSTHYPRHHIGHKRNMTESLKGL